ncbi:hypothetical protein Pla175_51170 [Pirellulimonas nuda]|uniref:DUF4340 domain-containing protein n=1 Tax=Pirellulimonas nuda TaxID=2528009 RepID=A0A518DJN2_9BACT|nr:DUF4340 domain-containing protein [Pirellulimonas nuda]QDU91687.1 hypothetical protein Pla175_51170 [Pirellulimonas nuda]
MNESTKTFLFVGVAAACVAAAVATRPQAIDLEREAQSRTGKPLVVKFDPEQAARLRITRFNEETATLSEFEVAERDGVWTLPSKSGYPADAEKQMGEAAAGVMDREVLRIASKLPADHEEYGVVDPKSSKLAVGQTGVGVRVAMLDGSDKPLIDLIIGKEVKGSENQRYVRLADQDVVYVVDVDPSKFPTKFDDWIEDDLLKINPWDLEQVTLDNYSASAELAMTADGRIVPQLKQSYDDQMTLTYDDGAGEWQAKRIAVYDNLKQGYDEVELSAEQELDPDKLRELKDALDNLKIVDVERKPEGLSGSLKAGEDFLKDTATIESLARRGFLAVGRRGGGVELISSEGEFVATMKDGVEYVLRFGGLQADEDEAAQPAAGADPDASADGAPEEAGGVNRYLFVMARFDENAIEKPELEELPALPEGAQEPKDESANDEPADDEPAKDDADTPDADKPADDEADGEAGDEKKDDAAAEDADGAAKAGNSELVDEVIAQRKEIEQSNQRKLDAYQEKIKAGQERVKELNARFGDWYYVISNQVYQKIHLTHKDVIKTKEAPEGEAASESAPPAGAGGIQGLPNLGGMLGGPGGPPNAPAETTPDPAAEEMTPEAEGSDEAEPSKEESEPSAKDAEPSVEDAEPSAEDAEPSAEESEPSAEDAEPSAENAEPASEKMESEDAEPSAEESEPSAEESEPSAEKPEASAEDGKQPAEPADEPDAPQSDPAEEDGAGR